MIDLITGDIYEFGENHDETYTKFSENRKAYITHPDSHKIIAEKVRLFKEKNPPPPSLDPKARPRIPEGWPADQPEGRSPIPGKRGELSLAILGMKNAKEWDKLSDKYSDAMTRARQAFQARVNPGKNNNSLTDEQMQEYWNNKDSQLWKEYLEVKKQFIELHDLNNNGIIEGIEIKAIQDRYLKLRELSPSDAGVAELMKIEIEFFDNDGDGALSPSEYKLAERFSDKLLVMPTKFGSHDKVFKEDF